MKQIIKGRFAIDFLPAEISYKTYIGKPVTYNGIDVGTIIDIDPDTGEMLMELYEDSRCIDMFKNIPRVSMEIINKEKEECHDR